MAEWNPLMSAALEQRGVAYFESIDSTNLMAKQLARQGAGHMTLVLANEQTMGRGRRGRGWFSQPNRGAWMSLIARPKLPAERAPELVMVSAVAMAQAIESLGAIRVGIKWPNDLVSSGKKLCGTLLEISASDGQLDWAVIGLGVNILGTDFPEDLPDAGSVEGVSGIVPQRSGVVEAFLEQFEWVYALWLKGGMEKLLPIYNARSTTLGARVKAICPGETYEGTAEDIAPDGALLLRLPSGELQTLYAGDVSVRGVKGYL